MIPIVFTSVAFVGFWLSLRRLYQLQRPPAVQIIRPTTGDLEAYAHQVVTEILPTVRADLARGDFGPAGRKYEHYATKINVKVNVG